MAIFTDFVIFSRPLPHSRYHFHNFCNFNGSAFAIAIAWLRSFILEDAKVKCIKHPHCCRSNKANFTVGEFYVMGMVGIQDNLMRPTFLREFLKWYGHFMLPKMSKVIFKAPIFLASRLLTIDHLCPARQIGSKTPHLCKTEIYWQIFIILALEGRYRKSLRCCKKYIQFWKW